MVPRSFVSVENRPAHWLADLWLRVIATFKLLKGTLLVGAGIAAIGLLNRDTARAMTHWAMELAADRHYHVLDTVITGLLDVDEKTLRLMSAGSFLYAALFYTEGFGLFYDKRWAEYLTILTTAGLIPFEFFELHRRLTPVKLEVLVANFAIVLYLAWRVSAKLEEPRAEPPAGAAGGE